MVIISTRAVEVSIQAVSPELMSVNFTSVGSVGAAASRADAAASAAAAGAAAAAAGASSAHALTDTALSISPSREMAMVALKIFLMCIACNSQLFNSAYVAAVPVSP